MVKLLILRKKKTMWKWLVFKFGDLRWVGFKNSLIPFQYGSVDSEIDQYEIHKIIKIIHPGDVILLRHDGYASNLGIGGALIHAAIAIGNDECIEAVSDDQGGVRRVHLATVLQADKCIIVRPSVLDFVAVSEAIAFAKKILGFKYDIYFDFNTKKERDIITYDYERAKAGLVKFCCTEVPYYCYQNYLDKLDLLRDENYSLMTSFLNWIGIPIGDKILRAESYIESNFEVVYVSKTCTVNWLKGKKCSNTVISKVESYMKNKI